MSSRLQRFVKRTEPGKDAMRVLVKDRHQDGDADLWRQGSRIPIGRYGDRPRTQLPDETRRRQPEREGNPEEQNDEQAEEDEVQHSCAFGDQTTAKKPAREPRRQQRQHANQQAATPQRGSLFVCRAA